MTKDDAMRLNEKEMSDNERGIQKAWTDFVRVVGRGT